uniref:Photosystem I reaction center subunit PsaK n=1 Tax=Hildenbrandia rivularis TaxID=135206 RepID=A0A1C9CFI9_9FLOR|nr:photosystem I subunit X [Hildenbrandia rivularis]AOM67139.1 photosystem I subunit X [Hildenbrandia rivularis]
MNISILLSVSSQTPDWSIQTASIMLVTNFLIIIIGRYAIKIRGLGPSLPIPNTKGFGLPELLATTSLGHILGCGIILGLGRIGIIG